MSNEIQPQADTRAVSDVSERTQVAAASRDSLSQMALTLFQCKDGSLVGNPRQCTGTIDSLPGLTLG